LQKKAKEIFMRTKGEKEKEKQEENNETHDKQIFEFF
jgi:hypothetical protein